jgi:quinol monooxygenase YgiN
MKRSFLLLVFVAACGNVACSGVDASPSDRSNDESAAMMAGSPVVVATTKFVALDSRIDDLRAALRRAEEAIKANGAARYANVHQNVDAPGEFLTVSVWCSSAAFEAHRRSKLIATLQQETAPMLAGDPELATYSVVGSLDLGRLRAAAADPDAVYTVGVARTVDENARTEFLRLQREITDLARTQDGNRVYDFLRADTPETVASYEVWASPEAEQAHLGSAPVVEFVKEIGPLLAGPPQFSHYKSISR